MCNNASDKAVTYIYLNIACHDFAAQPTVGDRSFNPSLIHLFVRSFVHSFVRSLVRSLARSFVLHYKCYIEQKTS